MNMPAVIHHALSAVHMGILELQRRETLIVATYVIKHKVAIVCGTVSAFSHQNVGYHWVWLDVPL